MRNFPSSALLAMVLCCGGAAWAQGNPEDTASVTGPAACENGVELAEQGRHARALLMLERCHRAKPDADVRRQMASLKKSLEPGQKSSAQAPVSLALTPEHATARLRGDGLPEDYRDVVLLSEDELWLPHGHYEIEVQAAGFRGGRFAVDVESTDRMLVPITLKQETASGGVTEIDMGEEQGPGLGQVASTPDPRPKEFKTLLAKRYARAPRPEPIPVKPRHPGHGPWPYLAAGTGAAAIGTGVILHSRDRVGPALVSYGTGVLLGGLATYLFLHQREQGPAPLALDVGSRQALLVWQGTL